MLILINNISYIPKPTNILIITYLKQQYKEKVKNN